MLRVRSTFFVVSCLFFPCKLWSQAPVSSHLLPITSYPENGCQESWCTGPGEFHCPEQLSLYTDPQSGHDFVMVSDSDNFRIQLIDPATGNMAFQLGGEYDFNCNGDVAPPLEKLCGPHDAAQLSNGDIIVSDTYHQRYVKFQRTPQGFAATDAWTNSLCLPRPEGLAVGSQDQIFSVDAWADCPKLRKIDFHSHLQTASTNIEAYGIELDKRGRLLVPQQNMAGSYLAIFSQNLLGLGTVPLGLNPAQEIRGVAVDRYENILIVTAQGLIRVYDSSGVLLSQTQINNVGGHGALLYGILARNNELFASACGAVVHQDTRGELLKFRITCIDRDGDGYGMYCNAGDDCDDNNPVIGTCTSGGGVGSNPRPRKYLQRNYSQDY